MQNACDCHCLYLDPFHWALTCSLLLQAQWNKLVLLLVT